MSQEQVVLELSHQEALVLFEFLSRFVENKKLDIVHQAEQRVLWDVQCMLERVLVDPFLPNYQELLKQAQLNVADKDDN